MHRLRCRATPRPFPFFVIGGGIPKQRSGSCHRESTANPTPSSFHYCSGCCAVVATDRPFVGAKTGTEQERRGHCVANTSDDQNLLSSKTLSRLPLSRCTAYLAIVRGEARFSSPLRQTTAGANRTKNEDTRRSAEGFRSLFTPTPAL